MIFKHLKKLLSLSLRAPSEVKGRSNPVQLIGFTGLLRRIDPRNDRNEDFFRCFIFNRTNRGFTLIEVVMALAIFAMAMSAFVGFQGRGYVNNARARKMLVAVDLSRQKMVDWKLQIDEEIKKGSFPEDKSEEGEFEEPFNDYRWKIELQKTELPIPPVGEDEGEVMQQMVKLITKQITDAVREMRLTVYWTEMDKQRELSIVTHIVKM